MPGCTLIRPQSPVVGTGMESAVAESMGWVVRATHPGTVIFVDANSIILEVDKSEIAKAKEFYSKSILEHALYDRGRITYSIIKFHRTAGSTCYNQKPVVKVGDKIKR